MTNLEKIDCAVTTTLKAHPDYSEFMTEILTKKLLDDDPFVTAKFFSRANDARVHMVEVSDLDLLSEIIKNAVKVSVLIKEKGMKTEESEQYLDGSKDSVIFGSTACRWLTNQLERYPATNVDDILEHHPEILPLLVSVFKETRYDKDAFVNIQDLDNPKLLEKLSSMMERIERDIHTCTEV